MKARDRSSALSPGRALIIATTTLALLATCRRETMPEQSASAPSDDEATRLSQTFATVLAKASGVASSGSTLNVANHSLTLTTVIEQVASVPGDPRMAAGVLVTCDVDSKRVDALTSGSVGVDTSRETALRTAAVEWAMQYGTPIVDALSAKSPVLEVGGYKVYAGPVGIRGAKPERLEETNQSFFRALEPALASLLGSKDGLRTLTLMVVWSEDGTVEGEFRVDGQVSSSLRQRALAMKWPAAAGKYMLKQYYVLIRG